MPFSALPLPLGAPVPDEESLAPPLFNQKPAASGDNGVPPPLPPTIFHVFGPAPARELPPPSALPESEAAPVEPSTKTGLPPPEISLPVEKSRTISAGSGV